MQNRVSAQRPFGVTILGRLSVALGALIALGGITLFFVGLSADTAGTSGFNLLFAIAGIFFIVTSLPYCVIGIGLLELRDWTWWLSIVLSGLSIAGILSIDATRLGHVGVSMGAYLVVRAALDTWILFYLFRPAVRLAFESRRK